MLQIDKNLFLIEVIIFLLSEAWFSDKYDVQLPNYNCKVELKTKNIRAVGV